MSKHTIDRQALAMRIRQLEGLTNQEKSDLLELLNSQKKYGLVWENKPERVEEELRSKIPVFTEVKDRAIINDIPTEHYPNHLLIEGDNLQALTTLAYTHEGKIDVIYIDPPYNTGNKDFVYNDHFVDSEDSYRHSKWLSFMSRRLEIAKRLLSEKGVILISIDDYSFAQLKLLCDEIFERTSNPNDWNFLECMIWNKQHSQQQGVFKRYHEYVLVYAKNGDRVKNVLSKGEGIIEAGALKKVSQKNPSSKFRFPAGVKFEAPDGTRIVGTYGDSEKVTVIEGELVAKSGKTLYPVTLEAGWTQKKQMESWFDGNETIDTKGQKVVEFYFNSTGKLKCRKNRGVVTPSSILPEFGMGSKHTEHIEFILGKRNVFSNPKPVDMIKMFGEWFCPSNGVLLDFFAGSGTTLESTMQLNAEDSGRRQCILVTNNENKICEEVTYERNKRVINGYTTPKGEQVEGLHHNNLRYYKTELVERENSQQNRKALMKASADLLCIKEDIYTEKDELNGTKFNKQYIRFYQDGDRSMLLVFDPRAIDSVVERLGGMAFARPVKVYVYSADEYPYTDDFAPVADKVQLVALPTALRKALQNVLPADGPQRPVEGMEPAADATADGDLFNQPTGEE